MSKSLITSFELPETLHRFGAQVSRKGGENLIISLCYACCSCDWIPRAL